ncbi:hypothetical protein [Actinoplanes couchii]|uniref:Uncharacterized protein n=1 Tax=Actinoplanes couchii TaxID=403638 RepID=A0ABQ3XSH2_9ACTN|nr:hypothetical protein [Actinoplanes couchii]MDR6320068.1 hypothetical protein [Actinoplanes couchii]GID61461.1 hypothetical protein Aco03nite_098650 [Actinoplanes couchii]
MPRFRILLPVALLIPVAVVATSLWAVNREAARAPEVRKLAEVTREVKAYTEELERTAGRDLESWGGGPEPCELRTLSSSTWGTTV